MEMWLNKVPVLNQWCWRATLNLPPGSLIKHRHEKDPNNYTDFNIVSDWLKYADYYSGALPLVNYFDSKEEREAILNMTNEQLLHISMRMREESHVHKCRIYNKWYGILDRIQDAI
jgi:hypothetical protein